MPYKLDFYDIFLLPRNEQELTRAGIVLYLTGLFCTFVFFSQFNILSIDMLKPQCIVIGLYVWLLSVVLPRGLLLACSWIKRSWVSLVTVLILNVGACAALIGWLSPGYFFSKLLFFSLVLLIYYFNIPSFKWLLVPPAIRNYLFIPMLALCFSLSLLGNIPFSLGGTKPAKVYVTWKKDDLLKSRFVKNDGHYNLLYETGSDYYFMEIRPDADTGDIFGYEVNRVAKSEIIKLKFQTDVWLNF
jgi:hypothetical protein